MVVTENTGIDSGNGSGKQHKRTHKPRDAYGNNSGVHTNHDECETRPKNDSFRVSHEHPNTQEHQKVHQKVPPQSEKPGSNAMTAANQTVPVTFSSNLTTEGSTLKIASTTNHRNNTEFVADGDKNGELGKRTDPTKVDKNHPLFGVGVSSWNNTHSKRIIRNIMKLYAVTNSEQLKIELSRIKIPAFKALNLSKLNQKEYTRLWLARLGQPDLNKLNRMMNNNRAVTNLNRKLATTTTLNEDNWIQTKGNFRVKTHKRIDELLRCDPNEKPWDVIYFDGHGPMEVKSINGCTYAYYFRSRKGGAIIVKGVKNKDQFPWVFEEVIREVKNNRGFSPKKVMCDNAGEFISETAMSLYDAYDLFFDPIAPESPESGGLWEKCVGDIKRRSTTNMIQAPWMPASMWLLADQYAAQQMYVTEYTPNEGKNHHAKWRDPQRDLQIGMNGI